MYFQRLVGSGTEVYVLIAGVLDEGLVGGATEGGGGGGPPPLQPVHSIQLLHAQYTSLQQQLSI